MDLDECSQGYCGENFGCTNGVGYFECYCGGENHTGFVLNETEAEGSAEEEGSTETRQCLDIDECPNVKCPEKGTCKNTARDFQ